MYDIPEMRNTVCAGDAGHIQKGVKGVLKKGTTKLLTSGLARAQVLAHHCVRPNFVRRCMRSELVRQANIASAKAQDAPTIPTTFLIEYCCGEKCKLMHHWHKAGGDGLGVHQPDWDASPPNIVRRVVHVAMKEIRNG